MVSSMRQTSLTLTLFDHQQEFVDTLMHLPAPQRALLFFKTGAGKTLTAVLGMKKLGQTEVLVIAPPSTHQQWEKLGQEHGVNIETMSHAKFRMASTKLSRTRAIVADEFHLFGGQKGQGWRKLDKLAMHLQAPLFLLSATPQYNDAERCYCIQHILDPLSCRGGYLQFLYQHCKTEQNPFSMEPVVTGFLNFGSAAEYLASMPGVYYLPDDTVIDIQDIEYEARLPKELLQYSLDRRKHRIMSSIIEQTHTLRYQALVKETGTLQLHVFDKVLSIVLAHKPILIYSNHATIALALMLSFAQVELDCAFVTGATTKLVKETILQDFRDGKHNILIGTATLATGTDGLDKVCDTLLILDDTDDEALRRQLIGRILPRGDSVSIADKQIFRMVPTFS